MYGIDISHYQNEKGAINFGAVKASKKEFCFVKCTEGLTYTDPFYEKNKAGARASGMVFGSYHFARGYDAIKEADFFLSKVGEILPGEILILDFEINIGDTVNWCKKFLDRVTEKAGFRPMLYTNEARVTNFNWKPVVDANYGLWVAKYASSVVYVADYLQRKPSSGVWPFWAIWQYSSKASVPGIVGNCDINVTDMSVEILRKYGKPGEIIVCNKSCKKHCV